MSSRSSGSDSPGSLQSCLGLRIERGESLVQHLESDDYSAISAILLPHGYHFREGSELWDGVKLGRLLGSGMQAKVYRLARHDGAPTGKVIKVNREDLGNKMLNNDMVWVGMHREWRTGTQLRAALQQADGAVPGFMLVADCVLHRDASPSARARFGGMVMGELQGWEVYKRIDVPEFHNIHYVREMLFQVFSALDRAQRKLGFHHADLGMRNIMEHYPRTWEQVPGWARARAEVPVRPGYTCNADGSRLPLGPDIEFKIIDFGIAKFSEKLAQAAGGRESQETMAQLQEMFGTGKRLLFSNERKIKVRMACFGGLSGSRHGSRGSSPRAGRSSTAEEQDEEIRRPERYAATSPPPEALASARHMQSLQRKKKSPIETMHFWHRKGDVFHLLLGIALALDDRVWPQEDIAEVQALISLVHHVTGIRLKASFAEQGEGPERRRFGKLRGCVGRPQVAGDDSDCSYEFGRIKAHAKPYK
ncbi:hypothetical protein CHLNCDRAFT_144739 [Chlorella variabilis]|uniref:Protein kinase domain-containing protein n=1 Tax=Chlorella variabilis TaxID=554065 RepID=E1ZCX1_CHLVA|nr:hypothetical protein CHLNCDRAFT_144739 [Chlorella variabilis]EFN56122.1 hypothetical protein CHLNCDRAFT_144739 [Chlorella variabilis]|eukprot:XP_005848224.1 hypothetical protein CHLNCDRAFT_144739 [Chlorella variabilis]